MTDQSPNSEVDEEPEALHHALIDLHALSGAFGDVDPGLLPGFRPSSPGSAMRAVAEAPVNEIPVSARLGVLFDLARAGFPDFEAIEREYRLLAASVTESRGLDTDQLFTDLKEAASEEVPFRSTLSGRGFRHHETAFMGEDICTIRTVKVGGLTGTWIFSEFETDAPFESVKDWVDPRRWPQRGPLMFKRMEIVGAGAPVDIDPPSDGHWHAMFHEEVQLVKRVNTLLHCDYWQDGDRAAGMTYELNLSLDSEIDVDRGFLLVNDTGPVRRVKALKIVGFTTDVWDQVAQLVCPFWTDWVRGAVQGGNASVPKTPTLPASEGPGSRVGPLGESLEAWVEFFGDSARTYLDLFEDVTSRINARDYSASDFLEDGTRSWSQLAKDWARAWTFGLETLDEVAEQGLDAGLTPPGVARETGRGAATAMTTAAPEPAAARPAAPTESEGTFLPVAGLGQADRPVSSDLVSIEAGGATIASRDVAVAVESLEDGTPGVRLRTTDTSVPPGLYVGRLDGPDGQLLAHVQLYVSRVTEA